MATLIASVLFLTKRVTFFGRGPPQESSASPAKRPDYLSSLRTSSIDRWIWQRIAAFKQSLHSRIWRISHKKDTAIESTVMTHRFHYLRKAL
jgi:hypothetical protein